jgi:hypothetical protein
MARIESTRHARSNPAPAGGRGRRSGLGALIALGAAMASAACATRTDWQRPDTAPYQTQNDLERCWAEADAAVPYDRPPFQQQPSFGLVPSANGSARTGAVVIPDPAPVGADVSALQQRTDMVDTCMRGHGYAPSR